MNINIISNNPTTQFYCKTCKLPTNSIYVVVKNNKITQDRYCDNCVTEDVKLNSKKVNQNREEI